MRIAFPGDAASLAAGLLPQQSRPGRVTMNRADITSPQSCWDFPSPRSVKDGRGSMQNPSQRKPQCPQGSLAFPVQQAMCQELAPGDPSHPVFPSVSWWVWCPGSMVGGADAGCGQWQQGRAPGTALCTDQCLQQNVFLLHLVVSIFQLFILCEDPLPLRPWPSEVQHLFTRSTACLSV